MAVQLCSREELNILRRKEWERRNQEAQQDRELYQGSTPLFGIPYKTRKDDELSRRVQKMLGNYEGGESSLFCQYDDASTDYPPVSVYACSGNPTHKDKIDPSFDHHSYAVAPPTHTEHSLGQSSKNYQVQAILGKEATPESNQRKTDPWLELRDYTTLPLVLPELSPPADPVSPLHSSVSSDSEQGMDKQQQLFPKHDSSSCSVGPLLHLEAQKEMPQIGGDAPPLASQTIPLLLSAKPNLANSRKPMALVRPMDGLDQVTIESPDLKPSPDDIQSQSYESLLDLKISNKPSLPPLKMPSQSIETMSNEVHCVEEILREMTYSWPPLLTAIQTPEPPKFSFPSKVLWGYQQNQKYLETSPKAPSFLPRTDTVVSETHVAATLTLSSGGQSGSSSDLESSLGSEFDGESGPEEVPQAPRCSTLPSKEEGLKDITWKFMSWIKENQQSLNPQNHVDATPKHNLKTTTSTMLQPQTHTAEASKVRTKRHCNFHSSPEPPQLTDAVADIKSAGLSQHANKKDSSHRDVESGHRKTVGSKRPGKSSKTYPLEKAKASLAEVSPQDKDFTFTDRPKVKTKNPVKKNSGKLDDRKTTNCDSSGKRETAPTVETRKEPDLVSSYDPVAVLPPTPPPKSSSMQTETLTKSFKQPRSCLPTREAKSEGTCQLVPDPSHTLVVKFDLSLLSKIPQQPQAGKVSSGASLEALSDKKSQKKEHGCSWQHSKKRPPEKRELSGPMKKPKLEKEIEPRSSSSQQSSIKTKVHKSTSKAKEKNSKKAHPSLPHLFQEHPKNLWHKCQTGGSENGSELATKHKKKTSNRTKHEKSNKQALKSGESCLTFDNTVEVPATHRPLLTFEYKPNSVDYYLREAKKIKHKADAMLDKIGKAFTYLDAAMSFVESGIAMGIDPQTPKSAYTMFSETIDLIGFILKLKNYLDPSAPASERDFLVLCMRCKALLQMGMFRCKRESALKYSHTLSDHFKNSKPGHVLSPCISNSTVALPQVVQQVASSYVHITGLFLSAHDTWEQADEWASRGSGLLNDLDVAMGQLNLMSDMMALVRYTRQGLHWLRLDTSNSQ